jgi:hypothetical protein
MELFTSEGCSSCPPADQLLAKLEAEQPIKNVEIIALEEHVDYWNNLGWTDPFSSDSATMRQYVYAGVIGNENAYTPQMVVDGQDEFVGSRELQAKAAIERAGSREKTDMSVTLGKHEPDGTQAFHIKVGAIPNSPEGDTSEVWMAITETGLHSAVARGKRRRRFASHGGCAHDAQNWVGERFGRNIVFNREQAED